MHGIDRGPGTAEEDQRHHDDDGELGDLYGAFGDGCNEKADACTGERVKEGQQHEGPERAVHRRIERTEDDKAECKDDTCHHDHHLGE